MTIDEYQIKAHSFAQHNSKMYPFLGLAEEAGEVCGKMAKFIRKHNGIAPRTSNEMEEFDPMHIANFDDDLQFAKDVSKELGDCCWMIAECATVYGFSLSDIMGENIMKLADRKARNVIVGEGDNR